MSDELEVKWIATDRTQVTFPHYLNLAPAVRTLQNLIIKI